MPWFIVWLEWCFYAYWHSLISCVVVVSAHYYLTAYNDSAGFDFQLIALASSCIWVVYCFIKQGYAVG